MSLREGLTYKASLQEESTMDTVRINSICNRMSQEQLNSLKCFRKARSSRDKLDSLEWLCRDTQSSFREVGTVVGDALGEKHS